MGAAMMAWLQLFGGGLFLYLGAEWFVKGASSLATSLRVPHLIIGLTVVAYGTSAPEVIVGVQAAASGHGDVALGNIVGSNIANIGLILGIAALIHPARVDGALRRRELPVLVLATTAVPLLLANDSVGRWEGGLLLLAGAGYTAWMLRAARSEAAVAGALQEAAITAEVADAAGAPKSAGRAGRAALIAAIGLVVLLLGGNQFVSGAVSVAQSLGMSERIVGLTIVAIGTSLPELVTSGIAARRGHSDIAVGNVVGSNIFNVFLCLGGSALVGTVKAPLRVFAFDLGTLAVMTVLAAVFIRTARTISRAEGAVALALYAAYLLILVLRG